MQSKVLPSVHVILVSYNTAKLTLQSVEAILASKGVRPEITIVENASSDRTLTTLKRKFGLKLNRTAHRTWQQAVGQPEVIERFSSVQRDRAVVTEMLTGQVGDVPIRVLLSQENVGFGRANNLGMADSQAPYAFLINTDAFVQPDTLAKLVKHFVSRTNEPTSVLSRARHRLDNLGILAADLRNPDGSGQRQGGSLPTLMNVAAWIFFIDDIPGLKNVFASYQHHDADLRAMRRRAISKVGWAGGTALMISQACLEEIGGFDEAVFMYGEDVELCLRATQRHWDVAIATNTSVTHIGSASSGSKNALLGEIKGLLHIWHKHHSPQELWLLRRVLRMGLRLRVLVFGILRRYGQQRIYREALELV